MRKPHNSAKITSVVAVIALTLSIAGCSDDGYATCDDPVLCDEDNDVLADINQGSGEASPLTTPTPTPTADPVGNGNNNDSQPDVDLDDLMADPAFAAHFTSSTASCLLTLPGQDAYCECSAIAMWEGSLEMAMSCHDLLDVSLHGGETFDDFDAMFDYFMDNMDPDIWAAWAAEATNPDADEYWEAFFMSLEDACSVDHGWDYCDCRMMMLIMRYTPNQIRAMNDQQLDIALANISHTCVNLIG